MSDLDTARSLINAGVPVFVARFAGWGEGSGKREGKPGIGFWLPKAWQSTVPDLSLVDLWQPGDALCMVTGLGVDVIDIDSYKGDDPALAELLATLPAPLGMASTPSGGIHLFTPSLGVGTTQMTDRHVDIKSGRLDGTGRGYVFISPTVKLSRVTGGMQPYTWVTPPDVTRVGEVFDNSRFATVIGASSVRVLAATGTDAMSQFWSQKPAARASAAWKAVEVKLADISSSGPEGFRHTLMRGALLMGGYIAGGLLSRGDAEALLIEAVTHAFTGGPDADDLLWIDQGLSDGELHKPLAVYADTTTDAEIAMAAPGRKWSVFDVVDPSALQIYSLLDQDRAEAIWGRLYPALRYAPDAGMFVVRDADRWRARPDAAKWAVYAASQLLPPGTAPEPEIAKKRGEWTEAHWQHLHWSEFRKAATTSAIADKLRAAVSQNGHYASLYLTDLDTDPSVLWAGGVPWDLRYGTELRAAHIDPATPHLHTAAVMPERRATPAWDAYTATVWPDQEIRDWVMRVFAVAFTGHPAAVLPILHGRTRSGKSTFVERLRVLLGTYGVAVNKKLLGEADSHDTIVYALKGARLAFLDEGPKRGYSAEERLKQLTGGTALTGRPMRADEITFLPTHTLAMTMNGEPDITDPALRARIRAIPCETDESIVRPAVERLIADWATEAPGILARFMGEAAEWLRDRNRGSIPDAPESVRLAETAMAESQNPVAEWVRERCIREEPGSPGRDLYHAYAAWWDGKVAYRRRAVMTETAFGRALSDMGYPSIKVGGYWFRSLRVTGTADFWHNGQDGGSGGSGGLPSADPPTPVSPGQPLFSTTDLASLAGYSQNKSYEKVVKNTTPNSVIRSNAINNMETVGETRQPANSGPPSERADLQECTLAGYPPDIETDKSAEQTPAIDPYAYKTAKTDKGNISLSKKKVTARNRESARIAAVESAMGEPAPLPAVVDRAGTVLSVSPADAKVMLTALGTDLTVDVETSGYPVGHADYALRTVQIGTDQIAVVLDAADPEQCAVARDVLAAATTLRAFSAQADLVPLAHAGIVDRLSAWERMHDVVIPTKLSEPTSSKSDSAEGLKATAGRMLGDQAVAPEAEKAKNALFRAGKWLVKLDVTTPVERSGWANAPMDSAVMARYGASDVLDTHALARVAPELPPAVLDRERRVQRLVSRPSHDGLRIDPDYTAALLAQKQAELEQLGIAVRAFGIENPGSPAQVGERLAAMGASLPLTKTGKPSVAKEAVTPLRVRGDDVGELARAYSAYVTIGKRVSSFLVPWMTMVHRGDGRVRPTVYTLEAVTGRMSCVRPNMQQVPRTMEYRRCFIADEGYRLIGADFSQVEIRVGAILSQDAQLAELVRRGIKVHTLIAEQVHPGGFDDDQYSWIKNGVFAWLYGAGNERIATTIHGTAVQALTMVDTLKSVAPGLAAWTRMVRDAVQSGMREYPTYSGRVIHLGEAHSAPNYCVQGTARELLVDAFLSIDQTRYRDMIMLPVHDEIIMQVKEEDAVDATETLVQCMGQTFGTGAMAVDIVAAPADPSHTWPVH